MKTVDEYLSMGLDRKSAEYFAHGRRQIASVTANDDFTLTLSFDNGEKRLFDMRPFLKKGTVFEPFANVENFRRVYLDAQHAVCWDVDPSVDSSVVWNNKVDLCPDRCYIDSTPIV